MKKKVIIRCVVIAALVIAIPFIGMFVYTNRAIAASDNCILANISVAGVDLGGLTRDEAAQALRDKITQSGSSRLILQAGKKKKSCSWRSLALDYRVADSVSAAYKVGRSGSLPARFTKVWKTRHGDGDYVLPLEVNWPENEIRSLLQKNAGRLKTTLRSARIVERHHKGVILPERYGHKVKVDASVDVVRKAVEHSWDGGDLTVKLKTTTQKPKYTAADFKGLTDILGTYTTDYSTSAWGRCQNIANGARLINGTVVQPGKTFSTHDAVAPLTAANGYELAPTIVGDEHVDDYGGGICQVATTLYNAVIRAELKVKERHPHSLWIYYVPLSADATIAGDEKDFKFVNSTDTPVYIYGRTKNKKIKFTIFGRETRPKNRKVQFVSKTLGVYGPSEKVVERDPNMKAGTRVVKSYGSTGYSAELWKVVKVNGKVKKRYRFNSSDYSSTSTKIILGTGKNLEKAKKSKNKSKKKNGSNKKPSR
ncbi:MAG: VanW family protein [Anaerovoracaceae bacterium]|jgi:vancomycin resistance protein YoaR